jgi:hypothetical protein
VAVEVVGDGERQEGADAQGDGSQHLIADIEVIVGITGTLPGEDAVMGIVDGKSGNRGAKGRPQFHALEDEVDAELLAALHASQLGADIVFLADAFLGPLQGNFTFAGKSLHPAVVVIGALTQDFFADGLDLMNVTEEVDDVLWTSEQGQMAEDDDAVEAVIYAR